MTYTQQRTYTEEEYNRCIHTDNDEYGTFEALTVEELQNKINNQQILIDKLWLLVNKDKMLFGEIESCLLLITRSIHGFTGHSDDGITSEGLPGEDNGESGTERDDAVVSSLPFN